MRDITSYKAYIFDMDGTLYFKRPMQLRMAWQLGWYYLFRLHRAKELLLLRRYRQLREQEELTSQVGFEALLRQQLTEEFSIPLTQVDSIVESWMLRRPLEAVKRSADRRLLSFFQARQAEGKKVFVYSDYPARDKCRELGLEPDGIYWPDGQRIHVMKPEPAGLSFILAENALTPEEVLFIGDRAEKDGRCAAAVGADAFILPAGPFRRRNRWKGGPG